LIKLTDQSCLNRWITEAEWDEEEINQKRLKWLQKSPDTRCSKHGVIPIDNVLVDHSGKCIEDVGYFWDHAEQRYKIAHDYIIANYVCTSNKHYQLEFYRFIKEEQCQEEKTSFVYHHQYFRQLIDWVVGNEIPETFAFDCWFTNAANLNHINALDELQVDLDTWIKYYNKERTHSGKYCFGKTPMQTFLDSMPLVREKMLNNTLQTEEPVCQIK